MEVNDVSRCYKFSWRFGNYSKLNEEEYYSDTFITGSQKWRLSVFPKGNPNRDVNTHLSVYLEAVNVVESPYAKFCMTVVDQINGKNTLTRDKEHKFTEKEKDWGFSKFIDLKELKDPCNGYIVNDVCILQVEFKDLKEELKPTEVVESVASKDLIVVSMPESDTQSKADEEYVVGEEASKEDQPGTVLSTQSSHVVPLGLGVYPNAGQLFEDGKHRLPDIVLDDEKYEDIGGFRILKAQAFLYKQIWLKYGHIATSKILRDSYSVQVTLVSEIMTSIHELNQLSLDEMSFEKIEFYDFKIKMAENFEFNVKWLREWLEIVKKDFYAEQKLKAALVKQDQCLLAAMEQLTETKDEYTKKLSGIETTIRTLLSETQINKRKVSRGLLSDGLF